MGARGRHGVVQVSYVSFLQDKVHPASPVHVRRQADSLCDSGVARGRGTHDVDAGSEKAPVVSVFSWAGKRG